MTLVPMLVNMLMQKEFTLSSWRSRCPRLESYYELDVSLGCRVRPCLTQTKPEMCWHTPFIPALRGHTHLQLGRLDGSGVNIKSLEMTGGEVRDTINIVRGTRGRCPEPREAGSLQESTRAETGLPRVYTAPEMVKSYCYELLCFCSFISAAMGNSEQECEFLTSAHLCVSH